MKLFLTSTLKHPIATKLLEDYSGLKNKSIAFIPTAADAELGHGKWKEGKSWQVFSNMNLNLKVFELDEYINNDVISEIKDYDQIWLMGGMTAYLVYWLRRTKLDLFLKNDFKGVLVGSSSGAMCLTSLPLLASELFHGLPEIGASLVTGIGLVDFEIYPHYEDQDFDFLQKNYKGKKLYAMKDGETIIIDENGFKLYGEERIFINN